MNYRVNRESFLSVLNRVQAGLSKRNFVEQSSCIVFQDGWAATYNDEVCVQTKVEGLPEDFVGAVTARELIEYLMGIGDDEITLSLEKGRLWVRGARKRAWFRRQEEIVLPIDQIDLPEQWYTLPEKFIEAVTQVKDAVGTDEESFLTVCIHLTPEYIEASDQRQALRYYLDMPISEPFLVRSSSLSQVLPLEPQKIGETPSWVHLRNKLVIFSCRRSLEHYSVTDSITEALKFVGEPATLPKGAAEAAKLGSVFTKEDKDNDKITVKIGDGRMTVIGEGVRGGSIADLVMGDYRGPDLSFRIMPKMLEQLIAKHTTVEIGPGRLAVKGESWNYITVLGADTASREPDPVPVGAGQEEPDEIEDDSESASD